MVYPDDYLSSEQGSRDVIDNNDIPFPFIITLIRQGSSDHIQPNFPSPGEIRSMFNTSKIGECPEYASSPTTMTDPVEWRPRNSLDMLEERLLRMHQWADHAPSFDDQQYEGTNVTIMDVTREDESSIDYGPSNAEIDLNIGSDDGLFQLSESVALNIFNELEEPRVTYASSSITNKTDDDQGSNQREFDVEEYVDKMNSSEAVNSNFSDPSVDDDVYNEINYSLVHDEGKFPNEGGINRLSFIRIKQLEKIFKLEPNENDNIFIKEVKNSLIEKIKEYVQQKSSNNTAVLDDVEELSSTFDDKISHHDSVICDQVHELCIKLKDLITFKEDIINRSITDYMTNERNEIRKEQIPESQKVFARTSDSNKSVKSNIFSESNINTADDLETNQLIGKLKISDSSSDLENNAKDNLASDSFESLITFSRIPILHQNKNEAGYRSTLKMIKDKNKAQCAKIIPSYTPNHRDASLKTYNKNDSIMMPVTDSEKCIYKKIRVAGHQKSKDITSQKEDLVKKAALLGLVEDREKVNKTPLLTERAQLALLEKQIQGRMKNKQLALSRKKTGLPERLSKMHSNTSSKENTCTKDYRTQTHLGNTVLENNDKTKNVRIKQSKMNNKSNATSSQNKIYHTKSAARQLEKNRDEYRTLIDDSDTQKEISNTMLDFYENDSVTTDSTNSAILSQKPSIETESKKRKLEKNYSRVKKEIPIVTTYILPKEKINNWESNNATPSYSMESVQYDQERSIHKFLFLVPILGVIFALIGYASQNYNPENMNEYFLILKSWLDVLKKLIVKNWSKIDWTE